MRAEPAELDIGPIANLTARADGTTHTRRARLALRTTPYASALRPRRSRARISSTTLPLSIGTPSPMGGSEDVALPPELLSQFFLRRGCGGACRLREPGVCPELSAIQVIGVRRVKVRGSLH